MTSNPLVPEIPPQFTRQLVINGEWVVSPEERPRGWESWPVGVAATPVRDRQRFCALESCMAEFIPATPTSRYCSTKCSRRGEYLRARSRKSEVAA